MFSNDAASRKWRELRAVAWEMLGAGAVAIATLTALSISDAFSLVSGVAASSMVVAAYLFLFAGSTGLHVFLIAVGTVIGGLPFLADRLSFLFGTVNVCSAFLFGLGLQSILLTAYFRRRHVRTCE